MSHFTVLVDVSSASFLDDEVYDILAPFSEQTDDPQYLEFVDESETINYEYLKQGADCIRTPDGRIKSAYDSEFRNLVIHNGSVAAKAAGPLHHTKKARKSRKYTALPNYPFRKLYKSPDEYAEKYCCYSFSKEHGAYGYYINPDAFWDWYQIGGRWPFKFLVKDDCPSLSHGERSWCTRDDKMPPAPEGYVWVPAAAKGDIAWELMRELAVESQTKRYESLKGYYASGELPEGDPLIRLTDEGILSWGELIYRKDESLDQFLVRNDLAPDCKYPVSFYGYMEDGSYHSVGNMGWWGISTDEKDENVWHTMLQQYIESVPEDHVLVVVDCHI